MNTQLKKLNLNKRTIANLEFAASNNYAQSNGNNVCSNTPSDTGCGTNGGHSCNNANTCGYYTCRCTKKC